jgi:iron complex transport system ATP-binding protein
MKARNFINFKNVAVTRGGKNILNLTLNVSSNENAVVMGPNGSGKSTLAKLITATIYPSYSSENSVCEIFGRNNWNVFDLRKHLGIVTPDIERSFNGDITGFETVLSGFFSSVGVFNRTVTSAMRRKVDGIIDFLGLSALAKRKMDTLSSGEMRKFIIARALVPEPEVLMLDEPSNSLDIGAALKLRQTLRRIAEKKARIFLITHTPSDIIPEMQRFIFLKEGKIFADGARAKVFTSKNLSALFDAQVDIHKKNGMLWALGK